MDFKSEALAIKEQLIKWRRDFHSNPELGFEEYRTSQVIKDFFKSEGIEYKEVSKTGICAIIKGNEGKTIGVRGDMDALPLVDRKNCDYSSKSIGKMHACGHDAHTAILMGVAKVLNKHRSQLKGNVKLLFEPAEETVGGARFMIDEAVLENPRVDAVIGLHVAEDIECGNIGIKKGVVNAASNPFSVKVIGKGGHGAHPDTTIDPIVAACNIINALQAVISREIPPTDPAVLTVGSIHGGTAANIIPEEVIFEGIMRTMKSEHREYVKKRFVEIVDGVAASMRAKAEINIIESYPCLYNNDKMVEVLKNAAEKILSPDNIIELNKPSMGVESFAYFSMAREAVFYFLGCGNISKGIVNPAHGSLFDIDEDCLPIGVAIQCQTVLDYLNN